MVLTEPGKDRTTFTCQKCGVISTFTELPNTKRSGKEPVKKMSAITLRDHTTEHGTQTPPKTLLNTSKKESASTTLNVVRKAMSSTSVVSFDYVASDNKKSSRNVEPYKITHRNGEIILFAYDLESGGIRTFKIKNMSYVGEQPYMYKPRYPIEDKLKDD